MPYKDRATRHLKGLCKYCPNPVAIGFKRCPKCLDVAKKGGAARSRKSRKNRKKKNLCIYCGIPLHPIRDRGNIGCLNCLELKALKERINRR